MEAILFGLLGLVVGGAANHVGAALVSRERLALPRCPYCATVRPWFRWLALPATLVRRDRCASCGAPLPIRHSLIELGLAATYAYLSIAIGLSPRLGLYLVYAAVFALILVTDLGARRIPNIVVYPAIALAAVAAFFTPGLEPVSAFLGGVVGLVVYVAIALIGRALYGPGALGVGDVKLATFIGLITGYPLVIVAIGAAILSAGLTSLVLLATRVRGRRDPIPYAPFLVAGVIIAAVWGPAIVERFGL